MLFKQRLAKQMPSSTLYYSAAFPRWTATDVQPKALHALCPLTIDVAVCNDTVGDPKFAQRTAHTLYIHLTVPCRSWLD